MKILIATDGSPDAQTAIQNTTRVLKPEDRNLDLLCVAPPCRKHIKRAQYERRMLAETTDILEKARELACPASASLHLVTAIGSPAAVILRRAPEYDLTIIGSKGRGSSANTGLGPVASRVVEHAAAPVLISRELRSESGLRVLAAADGSAASLRAMATLAQLFDLRGSEITLMHVTETPWVHLGLEEDWETYDEDEKELSEAGSFEKELTREAELILNQALDLFRGTGASVETTVEEGNPADHILSEADRGQYDLIAVGASGFRDLKHSMLGSVSAKLAWHAPCSVLIVRESA